MQAYGGGRTDSGVVAFKLGPDYIEVRFRGSPRIYRYSHASAGAALVARMKMLALAGAGLTTCISREAHDLYEPLD